jgi:Spy/CpxP family protein refolding chaperone
MNNMLVNLPMLERSYNKPNVLTTMRKFALFTLLAIAALGSAQEMRAKDMLVSKKVFIALQAEVRAELKVTDDQFQKIKDAFGESLQIEEDRIMVMVTDGQDLNQMAKDALKSLTPEQSKRLNEVWIQSMKGAAVADEEVAKELKLTDEQKKAIDKLVQDAGQQIIDLYSGGNHDESSVKQASEIRSKAGTKMIEVLTEEQKKSYEAMKGKDFKFKNPG